MALTLSEYASSLKAAIASPSGRVTLVTGNEASDADSIVTALVYGYLLHQDAGRTGEQPIPIVKCNREDILLRSETVLLLRLCGVDADDLIFCDDAEAAGLLKTVHRVVLTDHNAADGPLIPFGDKVAEIIDHHQDLGQHPHVTGDNRNIAFDGDTALAASACSVVFEKFLSHPNGKDFLFRDNGAAARALLGVILIDSINLDPSKKKVCERDTAAASVLMELAPMPSQQELFTAVDNAKFNKDFWHSLEPDQCLRYDFKKFQASGKTVGLSSVLCPLSVLVTKVGWTQVALKYMSNFDLYGVLVNTKKEDGSILRELALMSGHASMAIEASKFLMAYENSLLQLEALPAVMGPDGILAFKQGNVVASRKQVAPGCLAFFASLSM